MKISTPEVLRGKPRLNNTRIRVRLVLGYLASGATPEQAMGEFPDLTQHNVAACLSYARDLSECEVTE